MTLKRTILPASNSLKELDHSIAPELRVVFGKPAIWGTFLYLQLRDVQGYSTTTKEAAKHFRKAYSTINGHFTSLERLGLIECVTRVSNEKEMRLSDKGRQAFNQFVLPRVPTLKPDALREVPRHE